LRELDAAGCTLYLLRSIGEGGVAGGLPLDVSVRFKHFLAQSVLWLLRAHPQSRVFLLAHNNHVRKTAVAYGAYVAAIPMGRYLQQSLGGGYRAVAVAIICSQSAFVDTSVKAALDAVASLPQVTSDKDVRF
jgi:erythromycin esterase